jgi:flavin-dependent dehydrogenase
VLTQANRVIGVDTDSGCLYAKCLIDASGARDWLSRQLGLTTHSCSAPLVARYGYLQGSNAAYATTAHLLADPDGWTWIAQVEGAVRGADVTWRLTPAAAGAGYFLVGDAANRLDPAASHGVLKALMSGIQAAQAVADFLRQPALQVPAQMQYRQWLIDGFTRDVAQLRNFYRQHPCPPSWLPAH